MTRKKKGSQELPGYTEFLQSLELSLIGLTQSNAKVDRARYLSEENHSISISWGGKALESGLDHFDVRAELTVKVSKPKTQTYFLELKAVFLLHIHCMKDSPAEYVDRFCNAEVRLMMWPYFREYVTSMCGRMHIPPVFLPLAAKD
ncbi:MAG TPA: protein-export chaperone SecB [Terriglobales bacterium]